jgi:hypothetical protein
VNRRTAIRKAGEVGKSETDREKRWRAQRFVAEYQKEGSCGFPSAFIGVLMVKITN